METKHSSPDSIDTKKTLEKAEIHIDESVKAHYELIQSGSISQFPLVAKGICKKYETMSSEDSEYVALKPITLGL